LNNNYLACEIEMIATWGTKNEFRKNHYLKQIPNTKNPPTEQKTKSNLNPNRTAIPNKFVAHDDHCIPSQSNQQSADFMHLYFQR